MAAVALFFSLSTQWRITSGMRTRYTGLDYAAVHSAMQMQGVAAQDWPKLFDEIRVMEHAAIAELRIIEQQQEHKRG